jgi:hypothetical protein
MALVQLSSLISEITGRSAGTVWQRTKSGLIMRTQRSNLNASNINVFRQQANAAELQAAWQNMTAQERQLWEVYAQFRNRPTRKKSTVPIGGQATFILENNIRMKYAQKFGVISPVINTTPVITPPPQSVQITSIVLAGGTLIVGTNFDIQDDTKFLFMYISRPLLPSQTSVWNKQKLIAKMSSTGTSQVITSQYIEAWATLPEIGQFLNTEIFLYDKNINTFGPGTKQRIQVT